MKQLRLNLRPPEKTVSLEIQVPTKKPLFNFKRMGKEILNLNKGLAKSLISQLSAEDTMMRFALEAEAVKAFKKSELRRHLNYLSNKLMIELNKELKGVEIDTNMLRSFIRNSLTYLSVLQELMGFNTRLSPRSFRPTSPTRSDRGLKRKNPDDFIEIQQAEALEEIGIHRRSDKLSQNFARRMNKVKPSQRFAFEQLVYCQVQCLLDICAYADSRQNADLFYYCRAHLAKFMKETALPVSWLERLRMKDNLMYAKHLCRIENYEEAIKLYIANIEIWGCLFNQFRNPSLQEFQHEVKMNKVHKLAFTSLCGLLHIYCQLAQGRKIKETLEMMAYVSELSNDLTLQESAKNYRKKFVSSILKFEEERVELEDIIVCGGEMILGQEVIRQMYQETAKDYIPDELPEMKSHMINRSLETHARTSKLLSAQFSKTMDELSANEVSTQERLIEAMEKEKQTRMDAEIKAIVDKEIAEFYKPKSLLDQEIQNELIEQVAKSLLSTLSPKAKRSATATMNTSVDQANSVDLVGTFSTGFPSHRVDSARDNDLKDLNLSEKKAEVSAFFNGTKTSTRKESVATKVRRLAAFDNKWHTSLGNHASICKAVRDNAETPMHKKLGEIIIDSFKNPDETCRPVSEILKVSKKFRPNLTEFCGASLLAATKGGEVISGVVQKDPIDFGIEVLHANAYLLYSSRIRAKREEAELAQKAKILKRRLQSEPIATKTLSSMIRNHSAVTDLSCQAFKLTKLKTEGQDHSLQKNNSKRSIQSYDESRQLSSFVTKAMTLNDLKKAATKVQVEIRDQENFLNIDRRIAKKYRLKFKTMLKKEGPQRGTSPSVFDLLTTNSTLVKSVREKSCLNDSQMSDFSGKQGPEHSLEIFLSPEINITLKE